MATQAIPSFDQALADQVQHTQNAMDLVKQLEHLVNEQRAELDEERSWKRVAEIRRAELAECIEDSRALTATIAALERRLAEAQQGLTVAEGG